MATATATATADFRADALMGPRPQIVGIPRRNPSGAVVHPLKRAVWTACFAVATVILAHPATGQVVAPVPPAPGGAPIQPPAPARLLRPWHFVPSLSVTETYSDNVALAPRGAARSDRVTNLSPGIRVEGAGPRVQGHVDYRLHGLFYANDPRLNNMQNTLSSLVTVELLENRFFVDARGSITQQNRSAFAAAAPDAASATANRVETSVYQLAPYVRGRIADLATYQVRFNATQSSSRGVASSGTRTTEWLGNARSVAPAARISWALDGNALTVNNDATGNTQFTRARGSLIYEVNPELHLSAYEGIETTDVAGRARQTLHTPGIGVSWAPTDRSQAAAIREKRSFGKAQTLRLSHRLARTAFTYTEDKEVAVASNLTAAAGPGTIFALMSDLLASSILDPEARTQAVNARLQASGQPVGAGAVTGFDSGRAFVRRNRQGSVAMLGINNTLTLTWSTREEQAVGVAAGAIDSFSVSSSIRSRVLGATWAYSLSALSRLTVNGSRLNTEGLTGAATVLTTQKNLSIALSRRLSPRTSVSVGSRHTRFDSTVAGDQRENAVLATLTTRF